MFLLKVFVLRRAARDWIRSLLSIGGVALGVAVFLAIRIANSSVMAAFASTVEAIAGRANLEISAPSPGLDELLFPRILQVPGVQAAAPLIELIAPVAPPDRSDGTRGGKPAAERTEAPVMVLGIDPFRQEQFASNRSVSGDEQDRTSGLAFLADPAACEVSAELARRMHLSAGSSLPVYAGARRVALHILGLLPEDPLSRAYGGRLVVMDIAGAQELFGHTGTLDRVNLVVDSERLRSVIAALHRILPASATVSRPERRTEAVEKMLSAFDLNLQALSLIALFVGLFLVYNTLSSNVVRRRGELGVLRTLGLTRRGLAGLVLAEAILLGVSGSAAGVGLGCLIASALLGSVAATVSAIYIQVETSTVHAPGPLLIACWLLGSAASIAAALAPAAEAAASAPARVAREGSALQLSRIRWRFFGATAALFLAAALLCSLEAYQLRSRWGSFAGCFLLMVGATFFAPAACGLAGWAASRCAAISGGAVLRLASGLFRASIERIWVVVGALSSAIAMLVGLSIMIGSFRLTVNDWVNQTVAGDVYVSPAASRVSGSAATLPPEAERVAGAIQGVGAVDTYRYLETPYRNEQLLLVSRKMEVVAAHVGIRLRQGSLQSAALKMKRENAALISSAMAERFHLKEGDVVQLPSPTGIVRFTIVGVYTDFTTEEGAVTVDRDRYRKAWRDTALNGVSLYAAKGADDDQLAARAERSFGKLSLIVRTNRQLRTEIMRVFEQTFRVTYALQFVAVVVAVSGIASAMIMLMMQRLRQFATLRALGATRTVLVRTMLVEAGLIAAASWVLGAVTGTGLALQLIHLVLPAFFHWTVQPDFRAPVYGWSLGLTLASACIAALPPALAASRLVISQGTRGE